MRALSPLSRRDLVRTAGSALATTGPAWLFSNARAQQKITKAEAKYQDHPNGIQRCGICLQFRPPDRCQLVNGDINLNGWCQFFAAKENAQ
jgi:hypothetical protein